MKTLLLYPPASLGERWGSFENIGSHQQSLGLAYIAACMKKKGFTVRVLDAAVLNMTLEDFRKAIKQIDPDIVGLTSMTPMITFTKEAIKIIKNINPEVKIVLGGPHVSVLTEETLQSIPEIDFAVIGEGEYTFPELVECIEKNRNPKCVKGIAYRKDGKIIKTPPRPAIENLDDIPFPARHLFPKLKFYKSAPGNYRRTPFATMMSSRGCPFYCTYCDKSVFGRSIRFRSAKNVVDEMELLYNKFGVREILFFDDVFTLDKKRVFGICDEINKRKLDMSWNCESRVDSVNIKMLKAMKRAGCWQVSYGIESGNQEILNGINKGITLEQAKEAVKITKKAGILGRAYLMLGLPGETKKTAQETIDFAIKLNLDNVLFSAVVPYPGTELFEMAKKTGRMKELDWSNFRMTTTEPTYVPDGMTKEELSNFLKQAYKSFYMRPKFILKQLMRLRSYEDIKNSIKGFFVVNKI